ncbi:hypothetical protein BJ878DRAFT_521816 [Calycina marina]|uniref:Uncharacterized protein n=1 Tax=Calycina marina TaxID=1763456 RepID=A0A9P7YWD2_9HELO|nr:hypothetical protein BJ878DRAFT_521816 [Calycina marina]
MLSQLSIRTSLEIRSSLFRSNLPYTIRRCQFSNSALCCNKPKIPVKAHPKLPAVGLYKAKDPKLANGPKLSYPQRMVIFHAGTRRTVFLGALKVFTIMSFGLIALYVVPRHYYAEDQPYWVPGAVLIASVIPLVSVAYITSPFVAHIKLVLPQTARINQEAFKNYLSTIPKDTLLEIYTLSFVGAPRRAIIKTGDLYPAYERFGLVNYARDTTFLNSLRPWWTGKVKRTFGVHQGQRFPNDPGVWKDVAAAISNQSKKI